MTCACCTGRSKVVTVEDRPAIHGRLTVTARYYWLADTGWSWCPEQISRIVLHAYGADLDITHLVKSGVTGDYNGMDPDLWTDVTSVLEHGRLNQEEPSLKQEMTLDEFMMGVK